jgi:hypothetical protein
LKPFQTKRAKASRWVFFPARNDALQAGIGSSGSFL